MFFKMKIAFLLWNYKGGERMTNTKITLEEQIIKLQQIIIKYTGVKVPEHMVLDFLFDLNFCMNKYNKEN